MGEQVETITVEEAEALRTRIAQLEKLQPKIVRVRPEQQSRARTYEPPEALRKRAIKALNRGETASGTARWYDTPTGRQSVPPEYRPVFSPGDTVRINPDAPVHGGDGKTWADVLANVGIEGVGEVVGTMYITGSWEPKYKVLVPGLTHGSGDGFRESELLPYE